MAYRLDFSGLEELSAMLSEMGDKAELVARQALYKGAGVMVKAVNKAAQDIRTAPFKYAKSGESRLPSPEEKQILLDHSAGIAKFEGSGAEVNTSIGYNTSGYADVDWNHMSSKARTNYKAQEFKGLENMTTSTLKAAGVYQRNVQNRKPIGAIANAINSGTSFMQKQPFIRKGCNEGKKEADRVMTETVEKFYDEIVKKYESGGKTA